jgi:CRISPR/Cas system-associated protein endoribonuclease Cas2
MILKTNILDLNNKKAKGFKQGGFLIQLFIYGKITLKQNKKNNKHTKKQQKKVPRKN